MSKVIVISGAGSGFGALTARALADAGDIVYAGIRNIGGRNADRAEAALKYSSDNNVDLRVVEMDSSSQESVDAAIATIVAETGRLDIVIHNVGHLVQGPTEAFSPEEIARTYDTNVLSTQRLNIAALPVLRKQGHGLVLWVGSSSTRGGTPPYLAPYFAAKAAMDSLAVSYAAELTRFGIETTIIVPGSFTGGTNHFASSGRPANQELVDVYEELYPNLLEQVNERLTALAPPGASVQMVADEIARVVAVPDGERPFRTFIDPANDGAEEVSAVADRIRAEFQERIGLADTLTIRSAIKA